MNFPTPPIETRYDYYKIIPEFKKFASQYIGKNYLIPDEENPLSLQLLHGCFKMI